MQIPYEHPDALRFCLQVQKEFKISKDNILNIGDECDLLWASLYKKSPDWKSSPLHELETLRRRMKSWVKHFPKMRLCTSNHGLRWIRKAIDSDIPSDLLRSYGEIIGAPSTWKWSDEIRIDCKHKFLLRHGSGYSGASGARNAAVDSQMSVAIGHLHAFAGVSYINTWGASPRWGMNVGCMVDSKAIAFEYGKYSRNRETLSVGVVLNGGSLPIVVPYEAFK